MVLSKQWKTTDGSGEEPHMTTLSALTLSIHLNKVILDREKESLKHLSVADFLSPFALCLISGVGGGLNKSQSSSLEENFLCHQSLYNF